MDNLGTEWLRCGVHDDAWSCEYLSLNLVWLKVDLKIPLLDFFGVGYHVVKVGDALDPVVWALEETLSNVGHDLFVLSDLWWDAN